MVTVRAEAVRTAALMPGVEGGASRILAACVEVRTWCVLIDFDDDGTPFSFYPQHMRELESEVTAFKVAAVALRGSS